jgi:hypothetical protein
MDEEPSTTADVPREMAQDEAMRGACRRAAHKPQTEAPQRQSRHECCPPLRPSPRTSRLTMIDDLLGQPVLPARDGPALLLALRLRVVPACAHGTRAPGHLDLTAFECLKSGHKDRVRREDMLQHARQVGLYHRFFCRALRARREDDRSHCGDNHRSCSELGKRRAGAWLTRKQGATHRAGKLPRLLVEHVLELILVGALHLLEEVRGRGIEVVVQKDLKFLWSSGCRPSGTGDPSSNAFDD